jgi:hypothetical protein
MADGGYRCNPEVIMPYRKRSDGRSLTAWQEELNPTHRWVRARIEHGLARMNCWKILREDRRAASTLGETASGIVRFPPKHGHLRCGISEAGLTGCGGSRT